MGKTDLIVALVKMRFMRVGLRLGMSDDEAAIHAEAEISNHGLRGFFGRVKTLATPDAAIVGMVEDFVSYIETHHRPGKYIGALSDDAINQIERSRNRWWRGADAYPNNLFEYLYYRTKLEVHRQFGRNSDDIGLDQQTIVLMAKAAIHFVLKQKGTALNGIDFGQLFAFLARGTDLPGGTIPTSQQVESARSRAGEPLRSIPFSASLPDLMSVEPTRVFADPPGRYTVFLYQDVGTLTDSLARQNGRIPAISYIFVLAVFDNSTQHPIHYITLERGNIMGTVALCEFRPDGSHNVIDIEGRQYLDLRLFLMEAMGRAMKAQSTLFFERVAA